MAIYITEFTDREGRRMAGPEIRAGSWIEAERVAGTLRVVGRLVERIDARSGERTLFP